MADSLFSWCESYEQNEARLGALYKKGVRLQWNADELPWDTAVDPSQCPLGANAFGLAHLPLMKQLSRSQSDYLNAHLTGLALSQLLHGEQGALIAAAQLAELAPNFEGKMCSAQQVSDEARHVQVFSRYVKRCAVVYPPSTRLLALLQTILKADSWEKKIIGMQIVVEGAAITSFNEYRKNATDQLLCELLDLVIRDEARHVAFAPLYMPTSLARMGDDEREDLADFAFDTALGFRAISSSFIRDAEPIFQAIGVSFADICREGAAAGGPRKPVGDAVNGFIVPMLERVGALTPRVRTRFDRAKMVDAADESLWRTLARDA